MRIPGVRYVQGRNSYTDRDGTKYGIAIHNTSNDASAAAEASYAQRRTDGVSTHLYVDDVEVIQSLDLLARAGHAGSQEGNEHAVAVEIVGVNGWSRQQWLDRVAWDKLGPALAWVCRQFGTVVRRASVAEMKTQPKVRAFYAHDDMRRAWGGTDHNDPGPNFPWDRLFQAVNAALGGQSEGDQDMDQRQDSLMTGDAWRTHTVIFNEATVPVNDETKKYGVAGQPNKLREQLDRIEDKAGARVSLTAEDRAAIIADLEDRLGDVVELRLRRVLGGLDGATPPAAGG